MGGRDKQDLILPLMIASLLLSGHSAAAAVDASMVGAVGALLKLIGTPLKVTAFVECWNEGEKLMFARIGLSGGRHLMQFVEPRRASPDARTDVKDMDNYRNATLDEDAESHQTLVVVDLRCNGSERLLAEAGQRLYLNYRWLLMDSSEGGAPLGIEHYLAVLQDLPALVSSEIFVMLEEDGQSIRFMQDKHIDTITKVNYILTNCLVAYLGAEVNYTRVTTWGYYNTTTGMWDGMIGELVHNTADLGASPLFFTTDRIAVIEYLAMTSKTRSKFIFRSPKLSYTENVFVLPFDDKVWICVIAVIIVSSVLLLVTLWAEWRIANGDLEMPPAPPDSSTMAASLRDTLLMMYGASCQQGSAVLPRSCSARTITMLTFTVLMFLYASYSANIVALLQSPSTKIQTLEDLLGSRLKFGVHDTVFNRHYFTHATEPTRRALYEQKIRRPYGPDAFIALEQGIDRIRHGLYAFHVEQGVGYKVISETYQEDEKCGLQEIQYLQVIDPYYAIQKNSSYKEMVKIGLFRLNEHGIQYRENDKLYTKKPTCSGGGGKFVPVSLVDVEPAVWIILWGSGLASAFFLTERLYFHFLRRKVRQLVRRWQHT
uniref:Ionotropic glutamate receptor C-terminal domain-containing protein n=1 Tax=Anopheles coluzzii TaxID=1518534 RepID=A0A8W7PX34_ANOCL